MIIQSDFIVFAGYQNLLKSARVPLLADRTCSSLYKDITRNMFCAGYLEGGIDTCSGDSGGPLVCEINGIKSFCYLDWLI